MKTTDFIKESIIADNAESMHKDHEVQMARQDCYNAAKNAIELHHLLKNVSEMEGLEGWVSEKITLAADYLKTVKEYLEYDAMAAEGLSTFNVESAEAQFDALLIESDEHAEVTEKDFEERRRGRSAKELGGADAHYHRGRRPSYYGFDKDSEQGKDYLKGYEEFDDGPKGGKQWNESVLGGNKVGGPTNYKEFKDKEDYLLLQLTRPGQSSNYAELRQALADLRRVAKERGIDRPPVSEDASAGASSAGAVAVVSPALGAPGFTNKKKKSGTYKNSPMIKRPTLGKGVY